MAKLKDLEAKGKLKIQGGTGQRGVETESAVAQGMLADAERRAEARRLGKDAAKDLWDHKPEDLEKHYDQGKVPLGPETVLTEIPCTHCGGLLRLTIVVSCPRVDESLGGQENEQGGPETVSDASSSSREEPLPKDYRPPDLVGDFIARIDNLLDEDRYQWASATLNGMRETAKKKRMYTEKMMQALDNIESAGNRDKKWSR